MTVPTPTPGEAAALPTIETIMGLACEFASAHYLFERFGGQGYGDVRDAARESLRAALARALPVGEARDARIDLPDVKCAELDNSRCKFAAGGACCSSHCGDSNCLNPKETP